ncbi:MAG: tetratricopeptide repeat protein [Bacteroidetes bacterium]|nr:tetratricopeptide repeat protein [Bacteroidota bacterium]
MNDKPGLAFSYVCMGENLHNRGQYDLALDNFFKCLSLNQELENFQRVAYALNDISLTYLESNQIDKAWEYANQSLSIAREIDSKNEVRAAYGSLAKISAVKADYKRAYEFQQKFNIVNGSLFSELKAKEIGKLEAGFEIEKRLEEQKRKEAEKAKNELDQKQRRDVLQYQLIFIFVIGFFVVLFFAVKYTISLKIIKNLAFVAFLLIFEFVLVLIDPLINRYTGGAPLFILLANAILALGFTPFHRLLENRLTKRFI